jgi:S-adenosylmethionine hydrolase
MGGASPMPVITLTTDFGTSDEYVGVMKGVILSILPEVQLVDLTHDIPAQDIRRASFALCAAFPYFPMGTVHLAVVDPGVGTDRRAIAVSTPGATLVGPDNGLFTYLLSEVEHWKPVELTNPEFWLPILSTTFHGRDIFAPVAAHLAQGANIDDLGRSLTELVSLSLPRLTFTPDNISGEVLYADRFGNLVTSIGRLRRQKDRLLMDGAFGQVAPAPVEFVATEVEIEMGGQILGGISRTFGDVQDSAPKALVGSSGFLEIAIPQGSAAQSMDVDRGEPVILRLR